MVQVQNTNREYRVSVQGSKTNNPVEALNNKSSIYAKEALESAEQAKISEDNARVWAETAENIVITSIDEIEETKENSITKIQEQEEVSIQSLIDKETEILDTLDEATQEDICLLGATLSNSQQTLNNDLTSSLTRIDSERDLSILAIQGQQTTSINAVKTQEETSSNIIKEEGTTQKQAVVDVSNVEQTKLQNYVSQAQASADNAKISEINAHTSELLCLDVISKIGTAIKIKGKVNTFEELPQKGNLDGDAYLVGADGLTSYPEYYWYRNHWEFLGTSGGGGTWGTITGDIETQTDLINKIDAKQDIITDLDAYVKNTDYANGSIGGAVKTSGTYAITTSSNGYLQATTKTKEQYDSLSSSGFISKGTLENIKEDLVTSIGDSKYQDKLTAGPNITIENNVISSTGGVNVTYDSTNKRMVFGG